MKYSDLRPGDTLTYATYVSRVDYLDIPKYWMESSTLRTTNLWGSMVSTTYIEVADNLPSDILMVRRNDKPIYVKGLPYPLPIPKPKGDIRKRLDAHRVLKSSSTKTKGYWHL